MAKGSRRSLNIGGFAWALVGMVGAGCSSTPGVTGGGDGGGRVDAGPDGHTRPDARSDAKRATDGPVGHDAKETTDAGGDSSRSDSGGDGAAACAKHLPAGFTQVLTSAGVSALVTGAVQSRVAAMTLDENDDPMFAYGTQDSSSAWSVHFTRWDACAGQFTTPVTVDTMHSGGDENLSIGYDPSTKEVGIAYVRPSTVNNWADGFGEIWLGTMTAPATSFVIQQLTTGSTDDNGADTPSIVMSGGKIYIAFWDGPYSLSYPGLVLFLESSSIPSAPTVSRPSPIPDGGTGDVSIPSPPFDAGADAGPPPPHYFAYEAMPYQHGFGGFANPLGTPGSISIALDSTGAPAIAAYQVDPSYGKEVLYWRPGTADAVNVTTFAVDNGVDLSLTFDGTRPRIAGHTIAHATDAAVSPFDSLTYFASDDGIHWSSGVNLPNNHGAQFTAFTSALAVDGMGHAAVVADINGGGGNGMGCGANPYVAISGDENDAGAIWAACGADKNDVHGYSSYSVNALYGRSRLKGTLAVAFVSSASNATDAGADQAGIIYFQ